MFRCPGSTGRKPWPPCGGRTPPYAAVSLAATAAPTAKRNCLAWALYTISENPFSLVNLQPGCTSSSTREKGGTVHRKWEPFLGLFFPVAAHASTQYDCGKG